MSNINSNFEGFSFDRQFESAHNGPTTSDLVKDTKDSARFALEANIAALNSSKNSNERALKLSKENLNKVIVNHGKPIELSGEKQYVSNIIEAKNEIDSISAKLDQDAKRIELLEGVLALLKD